MENFVTSERSNRNSLRQVDGQTDTQSITELKRGHHKLERETRKYSVVILQTENIYGIYSACMPTVGPSPCTAVLEMNHRFLCRINGIQFCNIY